MATRMQRRPSIRAVERGDAVQLQALEDIGDPAVVGFRIAAICNPKQQS